MKKALSIALIAGFLTFGIAPQGALAFTNNFAQDNNGDWHLDAALCASGAGTFISPWMVSTEADALNIGRCGIEDATHGFTPFTYQQQYYKLANDLSLSSMATFYGRVLVGESAHPVVFDGNNKTISGINIGHSDYSGLFASTKYAILKNLRISFPATNIVSASSTGNYLGALVGMARHTEIDNVHVTFEQGAFLDGNKAVGGLAGEVRENSSVRNSSVTGVGLDQDHRPASVVNGYSSVGGLIGNLDESTIENVAVINLSVFAVGAVAPQEQDGDVFTYGTAVGGLIGRTIHMGDLTINNSFVSAFVAGNGSQTGGLVGQVSNYQAALYHVKNCAFRGSLDNEDQGFNAGVPGALFGRMDHVWPLYLETSYFTAQFFLNGSFSSQGPVINAYGSNTGGVGSNIVTHSFYEETDNFGSSNKSSISWTYSNDRVTLSTLPLTSVDTLDSYWQLTSVSSAVPVDAASNNWVLYSAFNNGRPMQAALYNLGVFGTVTTPPPAQAPAQNNSNSSSGGSSGSAGGGSSELPASTKPKETKSSIVRNGNKLRVLASSPEIMRLMVNGRTVIRVDADGEINQTITLKRGISLVNFVTGKTIARKFKFHVK